MTPDLLLQDARLIPAGRSAAGRRLAQLLAPTYFRVITIAGIINDKSGRFCVHRGRIRSQRKPCSRLATSSMPSPERGLLKDQLECRILWSTWRAVARTTCCARMAMISP